MTLARLLIPLACLALSGCAHTTGPYAPQRESARDSLKAQRLTQEATNAKEPARAEKLLREALTADLYHGPAHNNLGVIYLKQGKLFEAAGEFQWAAKLLPGHPDPRMNLALTMEKAGRTDEALTAYASALEVYDGHIPTMQAMTRLRIKTGRTDDQTHSMLSEIALKGETEGWRNWARLQLTRHTQ